MAVENRVHPLGEAGVRSSLEEVAKKAAEGGRSPDIRRWSLQRLEDARKKGFSAHTPRDRARILLEASQKKLWVPDPVGTEFIQGAELTACTDPSRPCFEGGDCDDATVLLAASFLSVGLPTLVVGHGYGASRQIGHVLAAVHFDDKWHYADPSPIGGDSTEFCPLGKCVPFTRERIYSLPNERMICDESACLVPGKTFNPAGFIEKGHYIGVNGSPPQFGYRMQWLPEDHVQWLGQSADAPPTNGTVKKQLSSVEKILLASVVVSAIGLGIKIWEIGRKVEHDLGTSDSE